ncbi:uncharacterized protein LOC101451089 [Ceratitis capitata]|uniref:uncharacterized protein LOC101451089 n=1 Tax=Ceratitis capitata TaxID=7213 RepID=UPI0003299EA9|nr:uncharacterized protein LOC101451089 [Ceratitis capitata]
MLKWTASAQKLNQLTPSIKTIRSPHPLANEVKRRRRRATISNKENLIPFTSTPMVACEWRNSPLGLSPLTDILSATAKSTQRTPERTLQQVGSTYVENRPLPTRRHSTVGFSLQAAAAAPTYASTLPCFEEEYSPSTALHTGQQVALRGLLPDPFVSNLRYFNTPELVKRRQQEAQEQLKATRKSLPRKLEQDFAEIARECVGVKQLRHNTNKHNNNVTHSAAMSDQTLDKLIDAILDSARKDEKKKVRTRKSFNLRRRTLLKHQTAEKVPELVLSPSYAAGDDPASDLSFLLVEPALEYTTPPTPAPATPLPGTPITAEMLQKMPTPANISAGSNSKHFLRSTSSKVRLDNTFQLETPVRAPMQRKRQRRKTLASPIVGAAKRFKAEGSKFFEVGLALPSVYV